MINSLAFVRVSLDHFLLLLQLQLLFLHLSHFYSTSYTQTQSRPFLLFVGPYIHSSDLVGPLLSAFKQR